MLALGLDNPWAGFASLYDTGRVFFLLIIFALFPSFIWFSYDSCLRILNGPTYPFPLSSDRIFRSNFPCFIFLVFFPSKCFSYEFSLYCFIKYKYFKGIYFILLNELQHFSKYKICIFSLWSLIDHTMICIVLFHFHGVQWDFHLYI